MNQTEIERNVGVPSGPDDTAGRLASRPGDRLTLALALVGCAVLLAWSFWTLRRYGVLGPALVYLGFTSFVFIGTGHLALRLAGVAEDHVTWLGLRYVTGFALTAFVVTLAGSFGLGETGLWLVIVAGAIGWGVGARELPTRRSPRPGGALVAGELLVGAALLRVAIEGTRYWHSHGGRSDFTQYFDLLYHLGLVKSGIDGGLPLHGWILESGVPRPGYHPAFDSTTSILIQALHLPVDAAFFRLVLPVALFGMLVGLAVFAASWARSRRAGLLALGFVAVTFAMTVAPHAVTSVIGDLGLNNLRYFVYNPPAVLSTVAATSCLALIDRRGARRGIGVAVLVGILAGATVMMKANFAIVLVPSVVAALALSALRGRRGRPAAVAGIVAAALTAGASYLTTLGPVGRITLGLGRLGTHLVLVAGGNTVQRGYSALFTRSAAPLNRLGPVGDALLVLLYILVAPLGLWLVVTVLAAWRAKASGEPPFGRSPDASRAVLLVVGLTVFVALFVSQKGIGYLSSWNISWHTVQDLWWLALCAAAVALDGLLASRRREPAAAGRPSRRTIAVRICAVVATAFLLGISLHGITAVRQVGGAGLPIDARLLLQGIDSRVPVGARVVQDINTRTDNWTSALSGRGAVLERSSWTRWVYPARTARLEGDIAELYETPNPADALHAAADMGARYAVANLAGGGSRGLKSIGAVVARRGSWALLELP